MKGVILAAGYATRLYPLTQNTAKPLLLVAKTPIITHVVRKIEEVKEVDHIYVVTNHRFYSDFCSWEKSVKSTIPITILDDGTQSNDDRLGAVGDTALAIKKANLDDDLLLIAGDNLFDFSLLEMVQFFHSQKKSVIALKDVGDRTLAKGTYGVIELDKEKKVIGFEEKPLSPKTSLVATAAYIYPRSLMKKISDLGVAKTKLDNAGDLFALIAREEGACGFEFSTRWYDIGNLLQYREADNIYSQKTVLVTGCGGFLGSHLCEYLLQKGYSVVGMDNYTTGNRKNTEILRKYPSFTFIEFDVTKYIDMNRDIDYIMHFASPASPIDYQQIPIKTLKVGAMGTHNLLGLALKKQAKFFLASTSEVYGDPLVHPQPESYWGNVNPVGIRGCYDEAKRYAEALTMAYHRVHHIDTKIVRIFNTYGPRMRKDDGRVVPAFIGEALAGKDITVFGDGSQTRSFCYVSDLIEGIHRLMLSDENMPTNIGNQQEMSVLIFAKEIIRLTGSKSKLKFLPLPQDDPKTRRPDITKAKAILGWEPRVSLEDGLKKTIEWFREEN